MLTGFKKNKKKESSSIARSNVKIDEYQISNDSIKYPSSELLLSAIQREYDKEDERAKTLDTRVGIFISLAGALLIFISSYVKISDLKNVKVSNVYSAIPFVIFLILAISILVLLVLGVIYLLRVVSIKTYERINLEDFESSKNNSAPKDIVAYSLISIYIQNIRHNTRVNNEKIKLFRRGIFSITIAIILTVPMYILSINL